MKPRLTRLAVLLLCLLLAAALAACDEQEEEDVFRTAWREAAGLDQPRAGTSRSAPDAAEQDGQYGETQSAEEQDAALPKYLPETSPEQTLPDGADGWSESELRALLSEMTREQKVGQLFFMFCKAGDMEELIARYQPGGVLLFTRDYQDADGAWLSREEMTRKLSSMQKAARENGGVGLFIGSDEEGGTVTRASRNPNLFPERSASPQALLKRGGLNAILTDAAEKSYLLQSYGINVNFAPVCDVSVNPEDWIYPRTLGRNAEETAQYTAAVVMAMRDSGVEAVLKHFPGYGSTGDTHSGAAVDDRPLERFRQSDFLPFKAGVAAGAAFVLVSHNLVYSMDASLPASLSPAVHDILRNELDFTGVILTDDLAMGALGNYSAEDAALLAIRAGNDMLLTSGMEAQRLAVLEALDSGALDESLVDEACLRVLRVKAGMNLL